MEPKEKKSFSFSKQLSSFKFAFRGIYILFLEEHNARIHLFAACVAVLLGIYFQISSSEWMAIIFSISLVFASEAFNAALENLADFVSPEKHEKIRNVKDLAAAAVLFCAIATLLIGLIIFLPKILLLF
ncbi:MAG: diacylglycerol kinase [Bacteroidetes bacterium B1(2017)]|nr:MAG: diacylglycerol kinase [Bacteroidetes bacterium B1(2017)]